MSSAWPPSLKDFVASALKAATPNTKVQVNDELKQIIFDAHGKGALQTTDWKSMDPVQMIPTLRKQLLRQTPSLTPVNPYSNPFPPTNGNANLPPSSFNNLPTAFGGSTGSGGSGKKGKKNKLNGMGNGGEEDVGHVVGGGKKKKNSIVQSSPSFPTPYTFPSSADASAKLARLRRFESSALPAPSGPVFTPTQVMRRVDKDGDTEMAGLGLGSMAGPGMGGRGMGGGARGLGRRLGMGMVDLVADPNVIDWDKHTIVGTNQRLEKRYLRLTSEPDPADVRPLPVLRQTLDLLKSKWKTEHNYGYICDQFKSLRQDLTVQRIKNEFTIVVYEIHARMALEAKDLGEYNQCQSMLQQLYERDIPGGHPAEFLAYRILYLLHTRNKADLARVLSQLDQTQKSEPAVEHALAVQTALATGNYHKFFRLYDDTNNDEKKTNMGGYIMDHFVERERMVALGVMTKGYMTLPLTFISSSLSFESLSDADKFLTDHSLALYVQPTPAQAAAAPVVRGRKQPAVIPLEERVWDCRAAAASGAVEKGMERYRTVDLKGQIA